MGDFWTRRLLERRMPVRNVFEFWAGEDLLAAVLFVPALLVASPWVVWVSLRHRDSRLVAAMGLAARIGVSYTVGVAFGLWWGLLVWLLIFLAELFAHEMKVRTRND